MPLKQVVFIALTAVFIPAAVWFASRFHWAERLLVAGALFSTCYLIDINFVSMEHYRGDTRGFEFGVTDWMIIALMIVMLRSPRWQHKRPELLPPNGTLMLAYVGLAVWLLFIGYRWRRWRRWHGAAIFRAIVSAWGQCCLLPPTC